MRPGGIQGSTGVTPDLTTLAKILAGGLPGGAVAGRADILSALEFRDDPAWNRFHPHHPPRSPHPLLEERWGRSASPSAGGTRRGGPGAAS